MNKLRWLLFAAQLLLASVVPAASLTEFTYNHLAAIHKLMKDGQYARSVQQLDQLLSKIEPGSYDHASVLKTYGYVYAAELQPILSIGYFEQALETGLLPAAVQQKLRYNLAQLYATTGENKQAVEYYERWFAQAEKPAANTFVFAASVYVRLYDYEQAKQKILMAISLSTSVEENWYQLLLAIQYRQQEYTEAVETLELLMTSYPDSPQYWQQLATIYFDAGAMDKSLAVMELAYRRGFLVSEKQFLTLVDLYLYQKIPYKAAVLLQAKMRTAEVQKNSQHLIKLGEAWVAAREMERGLVAFRQSLDYPNFNERAAQWIIAIE